ncbi:MAG: hypothetical protein A6F70_08435 [Cycloclasticus sp. symbiont of Bathymodiolus heckerae]|nr:MAG: hypothetical protein A6F70_08435 [Cycloclasticus sp. symbiont of Bathymodiolus heckerae]
MLKNPFKNNSAPLRGLQHIQQNLNQQRLLLKVVKTSLTKDLASHCLHITSSNKRTILFTDSSVWASKLLYMRQTILKALSQHFGEQAHTLKVKVLTKRILPTQPLPKSPSINIIKDLSMCNIESTDKLNTSMRKLIQTLKKNQLLN